MKEQNDCWKNVVFFTYAHDERIIKLKSIQHILPEIKKNKSRVVDKNATKLSF